MAEWRGIRSEVAQFVYGMDQLPMGGNTAAFQLVNGEATLENGGHVVNGASGVGEGAGGLLGVAKRHADDGEGGAESVREHGEEAGLLFSSLLLFGVTLLDFLARAACSHARWAPAPEQRAQRRADAMAIWY